MSAPKEWTCGVCKITFQGPRRPCPNCSAGPANISESITG